MAARKRCSDADRVVEILQCHAAVPDFLVYPEGLELPMDRRKVVKAKDLIIQMYQGVPKSALESVQHGKRDVVACR